MSIALLGQVYEETRRLAIAGSSVAADDFRLQKLVPGLKQAGEKSPVFAKLAEGVQALLDSDQSTAPNRLLELGTLINAVQYTQGETGCKGELEEIESQYLGVTQTQTSARLLKPLIEALTSTGSGRFEIIRDAHERNLMQDLRLVAPAISALDDTYSEIAEYVCENVIPLYGKAIVPELDRQFNVKGKAGHVRRLQLMHNLAPEVARPHVLLAVEEGSKEMKVAALACLGESPEDLSILMEHAKGKAKDVRKAALRGLSRSRSSEALETLKACIDGKDLELAVPALRSSTNPDVIGAVLQSAKVVCERLLSTELKDKKLVAEGARFQLLLECLIGREDAATEEFVLNAFAAREQWLSAKLKAVGEDILEMLTRILWQGSPVMKRALVDARLDLPPELLARAFEAGLQVCEPDEAFELFSPFLREDSGGKKRGKGGTRAFRRAMLEVLQGLHRRTIGPDTVSSGTGLNERQARLDGLSPSWLDFVIELDDADLILLLARPGHLGAEVALSRVFEETLETGKSISDTSHVIKVLIDVKHPKATDYLIAAIEKFQKSTWYYFRWFGQFILLLPKEEAVPKLEALLPKLPKNVEGELIDYVAELKNREGDR